MGARETNLTKKVETYWTSKGALVLKFHGNQFTKIGVPDLLICYKGRFVGIEIKVDKNKPTPIQYEMIKRINEWYAGYATWVNENNWEQESKKIIEDIEKGIYDR